MAGTDVAAPMAPAIHEADGITVPHRAGFESCLWGNFFVNYTPPLQMSEECMRERADQLKGEVRRMFEAGKATMSMADALTFVDTLEYLGISLHFRKEIDSVLGLVHSDEELEFASSNDLHIVALRFRLLRQHGFWVSADVFDKFKDGKGNFSAGLFGKPRDLLSLYNAAHMAIPGEDALDDAIAFARKHLEAVKGELRSPMAEQVSRALDIPLPRYMPRLEAMHYIAEYAQEEAHDPLLLELAKLDFNLVRSVHLKELAVITLWWRKVYDDVKLNFCRDRAVEMYFWTFEMLPWEECSRSRIILTKIIGLATFMDDSYDCYATFEDCERFDEAIQRWEESAVSIIPEYLRPLYLETLSHFNEFRGLMKPHEKHRMDYLIKEYKMQSRLYLQEAKWSSEKSMPTFKEHSKVSVMSSFVPTLCLVALVCAEEDVATEAAYEWAIRMPDMYIASGEIGRFLNDVSSYKRGKNKKDVASSVECYVKEHGVTGDEAAAAIAAMVELAWRRINKGCLEMDREVLPAARIVVGMSATLEVMYLGGRDGYTFGKDIKDLVVPLLVEPMV